MKPSEFPDAFEKDRKNKGVTNMVDQDDPVLILLRHRDVRKAAHNWKTFQSAATPGRIVIPSEVNIRDTRQIPFEIDPPRHGDYRALVEDWFRRPNTEIYQHELRLQIDALVDDILQRSTIDIVSDFALVLQSNALTLLLNIPFSEAKTWISWGTHVFRSEETELDADKANILYDYIDEEIDKAIANPGEDLYSALLASTIDGRKLTKEEVKGVMILTFAGGRDTVINAVTNTVAYFAEYPQAFQELQNDALSINRAIEELIRYFAPLTHMGRIATQDTSVCEHAVKADSKISLCWHSANRDETVFDNPNSVDLHREINPHVSFGFGPHKCLGAHHMRQILRILLDILIDKVERIDILKCQEKIEQWGEIRRKVGFDSIHARFFPKSNS